VRIVLKADDQHAATLKYVLASQRTSSSECQGPQDPQRALDGAAIGKHRAQKTPAKAVPEQPAARRWRYDIECRVPFTEPCSHGGVAGICCLINQRIEVFA